MPYIQKGDVIDYINPGAAIAYNDVVNLTTRIGIAAENIAVGATGSVAVTGVYELPAINTDSFAVGDALYWDPVANNLTNIALGNVPAGWATEAKLLAGTTARVRLSDSSFVVNPLVLFVPQFIPGERFTVTYPQVAAADVAKTFWIAPAACKVISAQERHVTVAGQACTLQIEKLAAGEAPGAGDAVLANGFDLTSAANTPVEVLAVADGKENLIKGDALALKLGAGVATDYALGTITVVLEWA
jgi:predicted RecA/RadA family phage recombinase